MWELLLPIFGFLIGTVASMTGIGGGVFIVPLLTLMYGFYPAHAVGTSLATIILTAIASTVNYSRQKRIYYKVGLILSVTTIPGAYLGAYLTSIIPAKLLGLIFGIFLFLIAMNMTFKTSSSETKTSGILENELFKLRDTLLLGIILSFFGGLVSGLLGVGGGTLIVPIMTLVMSVSIHIATATSMFTMIFTSISGVTQHFLQGNIHSEYILPIALGTIFGAQLGAYTSKRISGKNLRRVFGIVLIVISIQMILKYAF